MRRRSEPPTDERLNEEKARIEAELEATEPGSQRDLLWLMLRQIEAALWWRLILGRTPPDRPYSTPTRQPASSWRSPTLSRPCRMAASM